jgi:bifunctional DNA primase/polymerase-like protein
MLPIASEAKGCIIKGWPGLSITEAELPHYFAGPGNIGVRLGKASGGLCDVDLDSPEAITIADRFLPPTPTIFGRESKPRSHRLYLIEPTPTGIKFEDPLGDRKKATLVELRANAKKNGSAVVTVIPPGTHESGERIC